MGDEDNDDDDDDDVAAADTLFFAIWRCRLFRFALHDSKLPPSLSFTQTSCEARGQQVNGLLLQQQQRRGECCWKRTSLPTFLLPLSLPTSLLFPFFAPLNQFQRVVGRALRWRRGRRWQQAG